MLEQFKFIKNIGRFRRVQGSPDTVLKPLSLVYSENGRGKTTMCAVLRSLSTGDSAPILARKRLSEDDPPEAVIVHAGDDLVFNGTTWSGPGPEVVVFDDHFVDENVCSGLSIDPGHRQNLHGVVVGAEGVQLQSRVKELTDTIATHQRNIREAEQAVPAATRGPFNMDDFCALQRVENIEKEIEDAGKALSVHEDAREVQQMGKFEPLALPLLDVDSVKTALEASLPDLDTAALAAVTEHFESLGERAEAWVSEGMKDAADDCPFCGQDLKDSDLISHYRAYFSDAYRDHKKAIETARDGLGTRLSGDQLARFGRLLEQEEKRHQFWSKYVDLPEFSLSSEDIAGAWTDARDRLLGLLDAKAAAPLDVVAIDDEAKAAVEKYDEASRQVDEASTSLAATAGAIDKAKEDASAGGLDAARTALAELEATARRFEEAVDAHCATYLAAKAQKIAAEAEKEQARTDLQTHRDRVFSRYQGAINSLLERFNAEFSIERLTPRDTRGVPSTTFEFVVNGRPISTSRTDPPEPCFASALSAGDRNTLALAFFFASLRERVDRDPQALSSTIVVVDDPASSLDDGRRFATVEEIRWLVGRARQVVVLSHALPFLCQIWTRADTNGTATISVRNDGAEASTIQEWDAETAVVSDYDRQHQLVRDYAEESRGDPQAVAPTLRFLLEGFLRVSFAEHCPPGTMLGPFIQRARTAAQNGQEFLSEANILELDSLREYANQFHHTTNENWRDSLANINETELRGIAKRAIAFTRLAQDRVTAP